MGQLTNNLKELIAPKGKDAGKEYFPPDFPADFFSQSNWKILTLEPEAHDKIPGLIKTWKAVLRPVLEAFAEITILGVTLTKKIFLPIEGATLTVRFAGNLVTDLDIASPIAFKTTRKTEPLKIASEHLRYVTSEAILEMLEFGFRKVDGGLRVREMRGIINKVYSPASIPANIALVTSENPPVIFKREEMKNRVMIACLDAIAYTEIGKELYAFIENHPEIQVFIRFVEKMPSFASKVRTSNAVGSTSGPRRRGAEIYEKTSTAIGAFFKGFSLEGYMSKSIYFVAIDSIAFEYGANNYSDLMTPAETLFHEMYSHIKIEIENPKSDTKEQHDLYGTSGTLPKRKYTEKAPGHVFITQWIELESAEEENNVLKKIMDEIKPPAKIHRPEIPFVWKIKDEFVLEDGNYLPPEKNRFYSYEEKYKFKAKGSYDPITNVYICKEYDRLNYIAVRLIDKEWFLEEEKKHHSDYYPNMFWDGVLNRLMNNIVTENKLPDMLIQTYDEVYFHNGQKLIIPFED